MIWIFIVLWQFSFYALDYFYAGQKKDFRFPNLWADLWLKKSSSVNVVLADSAEPKKDSTLAPEKSQIFCVDSLKKNCIESFGSSQKIKEFWNAIRTNKTEYLRVGFMGDSYSEGDLISGTLREKLQSQYGGTGVGLMPITSKLNHFRHNMEHEFKGDFDVYDFVGKKGDGVARGIMGQTFVPQENAFVEYWTNSRESRAAKVERIRLFYQGSGDESQALVYAQSNDSLYDTLALAGGENLQEKMWTIPQFKKIQFDFSKSNDTRFYGVSFEGQPGIYVDNLSLRGHAGNGWRHIPALRLQEFSQKLDYRLIVLQYGLNAAYDPATTSYKWYEEMMLKTVNHLKLQFPKSLILVMSVGDRALKWDDELQTPPNILAMVKAQRNFAEKANILYWSAFSAMGGKGSSLKWASQKPALQGKDYTHLTIAGGEVMGTLLYQALMSTQKSEVKNLPVQKAVTHGK